MGHARQYREIALRAIDTLNAVGLMLEGGSGPALVRVASGMGARVAEVDRERAEARNAPKVSADDVALPEVVEHVVAQAPSPTSGWKAQRDRDFKAKEREAAKQAKPADEAAGDMTVEILGKAYKPAPPEHEPELRGHSPRGTKARQFRLIAIDAAGERTGFEDVGTAVELAERNHIGPSTVYRAANSGKPTGKWLVEAVVKPH